MKEERFMKKETLRDILEMAKYIGAVIIGGAFFYLMGIALCMIGG